MTERATSPVWPPRIAALSSLIVCHMTCSEICRAASLQLRWDRELTVQVLAAGEGKVFWVKGDKWWRLGTVAPAKLTEANKPEAAMPVEYALPARECRACHNQFSPRRMKQVHCSSNCRQAAYQKRKVAA